MAILDLSTLEKKLWDCADILSGFLNSAQYMEYIFGMLFLKRINDQFNLEQEAKQQTIREPAGRRPYVLEDPKAYNTFFIPQQARWERWVMLICT